MVNAEFPERNGYGFEMVSAAPRECKSIQNLHRIELLEFFSSFRRFNLNANIAIYWRVLVRNGGLHRNTIWRDGRDREMFFLLRLVFWIGLVLVLLPREKTPESDKLPQLKTSEALSAATAAVSDMSQFCKRQPAACEVGGQAATVISHRAQQGARKLYQIITDKKSSEHTGSIGGVENADVAQAAPRDTLTPDDLQVEWQAPLPPSP
jgi:hypothetical protein